MSEYRETVKNLEKVRSYVRDMYIYGFRTRRDFTAKSARTYDNERRRIESWLGRYIRWEHSSKGKSVFISVDSAQIKHNPLFAAWKSKSFTDNDITLHFMLLDALSGGAALSAPELTEELSSRGVLFDLQTVRGKLREYESEGLLRATKEGKTIYYSLCAGFDSLPHHERLLDAVAFFSEISTGGYIGSTILDSFLHYNTPFRIKHYFISHTLDDGFALELLELMRQKRLCRIESLSRRSGQTFMCTGAPLRILSSVQTGRRYITMFSVNNRRLHNIRLDSVSKIIPLNICPQYDDYMQIAQSNLSGTWGVSFDGSNRKEQLFVKLSIDETGERHVIDRIMREGRNGELLHIGENTYLYSVEVHDANEVIPWIRTFIGRIISFDCSNSKTTDRFYRDIQAMSQMYGE